MPWDERDTPKVFIVIKRNGDGYHVYAPDLIAAYFDEVLARQHSDQDPAYDWEEVPLAPQIVKEES